MAVFSGEIWKFNVRTGRAERVFLVKHYDDGPSSWIEMQQTEPGRWETTTQLTPGTYRFRYFTAEGRTFLNGGNFGLQAHRVEGEDPDVLVEPVRVAQPA